MDKTLLSLLLLTMVLVAMLAPHTILAVTTVVMLSVVSTQGAWTLIQVLARPSETQPQRLFD